MSANSGRVVFKLLVVVLLLGAGAAAALFYGRPVARVVKVARGDVENVVSGSVAVDALRASPVTSEVDGKVARSVLEINQVVKEGDVLVQLDTGDIALEIARARSELETAQANAQIAEKIAAANAKTNKEALEAAERDYKEGRSSNLGIEQARRTSELFEQNQLKLKADEKGRIELLENALKVAERRQEKMTLKAPFDGVITEVFGGRKNDFVTAKQAIATIIARERLVRAKISEENFAPIKVGDKAVVAFLGLPGKKFNATVTDKLPTAETDTQRYTVYLKVDLPPEQLTAGLTGDVAIAVDKRAAALLVPRLAMWDSYVYVVEHGRAFERKLDMGFMDLNTIEVKGGLKEGDLVIVEQRDKFHDGQRVRVELAR